MRKSILAYLLMLVTVLFGLTACSEDDNKEEEFPDWKAKNEAYFENLYNATKQKIASGDTTWKIFKSWSKAETKTEEPTEYIIVHVLNEGSGSGYPFYTDSVRIHYSGRLLPSVSYPEGFNFDKSWKGEYNLSTMTPRTGVVNGFIDGFTTALLNMRIGDRWEVYMPHQLAYGKEKMSSTHAIPPYSTLIFDITLSSFYRVGAVIPDLKAKETGWIEE